MPDAVWPLYVAAMAELAQMRGDLGVLDEDRIERIADTMDCSESAARALWNKKKAQAEANAAHQHARAVHKLTHTGAAKVWHDALVDLMEVSVAFNLREGDKRDIFPRGPDGRRRPTGLPTVKGPARMAFPREKVSYTAEQRKDWCRRLGFAPGTLSDNARKLTEEEFHARIAKREAELLPPHKLEGKKQPRESDWHASRRIRKEGPKTRKRAPCITSERRDLAAELGVHPDTVKKKTKGMTMGEIHALRGDPARAFSALGLSLRGRSAPDKDVRSTPDKSQEIGHFPPEDVTDHAPPKGSAQNENGHLVAASIPARKASRNERGSHAYSYAYGAEEGGIIHRWYEAKRGQKLTEEAARKWHVRDTFERKFFEACEWVVAQNLPDDEEGPDLFRATAEFWIAAYRAQDRKRRASARGSRLMPKWMRDFARAIENEGATMVEITPAMAELEAA
ncbi:hypothetical protein B2G69_03745 [Methylorubrum zatmanii]|nr:hypothetical protein [Methylorubrum zatmanii]ARO53356.1 hypothetical protein B2G69_03745 [Methylorubrum zatmanii]